MGDNVDFNNLIQNGFYTGKFSEHTPDGTTSRYWNVEVSLFDNNVSYVYQKACKANSNIYYSRYYDDQGWSDWDSFATNTDLSGYVPFAADIPSNQKFYMALVPGDENKIYFYSGEKPTAEYAIGYIALTKHSS